MKIRNLIVGMLFLFIPTGFTQLVEATGQQQHNFLPAETDSASTAPAKEKGVMLMSRIGPSASELYVANADGANERRLFAGSGFGGFLQDRYQKPAKLMLVKRDGTGLQSLTEGEPNTGFPSFAPDGKHIVYRVWGDRETGLRIMNLETRAVRVLTTDYDNVPYWSPTGERIVFTRKANDNFDVYTIRPDGTELRRLTTSLANDAHAVWSDDGRHNLYNSGQSGWKDEAAHYDNTFQPYGAIFMMKADGTEKRQLTDSPWEDPMPCFVPKAERVAGR
jgi:Tol biopolymer transport system component